MEYDTSLVSPSYFRQRYLFRIPTNTEILDAVLTSVLQSARAELERDIRIYFIAKSITNERHMVENTGYENGLAWNLLFPPVVSISRAEIIYGERVLIASVDFLEHLHYEKMTGEVVLLPTSIMFSQLNYFWMAAPRDHIPYGIVFDYISGYEWEGANAISEMDKEDIREAICRRAFIKHAAIWVPDVGTGSQSISMDGVSQSRGSGIGDIIRVIEDLRKQEKEWIAAIRKQHGTSLGQAII